MTFKNEVKIKIAKKNKEKLDDNFNKCPSCSWLFPKEMTIQRIDIHINKCLDGNGEKDKIKYENYFKYNIFSFNDSANYEKCPICNKIFNRFTQKNKFCHIQDCLKKLEKK